MTMEPCQGHGHALLLEGFLHSCNQQLPSASFQGHSLNLGLATWDGDVGTSLALAQATGGEKAEGNLLVATLEA